MFLCPRFSFQVQQWVYMCFGEDVGALLKYGVPWTYCPDALGAESRRENSVGVGWKFHLKCFIRRIVTPDPGGSASCAPLCRLVFNNTSHYENKIYNVQTKTKS